MAFHDEVEIEGKRE